MKGPINVNPALGGAQTFSSLTVTGATTESPRAAAYQWTAWNPSDTAGTATNAPATAAASVTATNYMTMANALGTVTFTFTKAGNYLLAIHQSLEPAAAYTAAGGTRIYATFGGTATRLLTQGDDSTAMGVSGEAIRVTRTFLVIATASQTLTILPKGSVVQGGGTASNYTFGANAVAMYVGT